MKEYTTCTVVPHPHVGGYPFEDGIFGVNLEITRKGFFGGLSAQMLNNRKLYAGLDTVAGWDSHGFERVTDRPEESLCASRFLILRDGSMSQTAETIALREGCRYEAKVWLKAISDTAAVTFGVSGLEQTVTVTADGEPYRVLSFVFDGIPMDNGTFTVSIRGEAAVYEVSLMPTDHFNGMRWDVIEQLRRVAPTSLRFPGGCAADHFDWKESLKAPEFRKPTDGSAKWFLFRDSYDQDTLDIGVNEFMALCKELNAEPEYTVSLILSDGEDARRLVEYCNGDASTEYGAKRQALGFDPFGVHLWYVGNEAYFFGGAYQPSAVAAARTDELISAMKQADPSIAAAIGLTWGYGYRDWAKDFMAKLKSDFEYVSYHDYIGILPDATQGDNGMATCEMLESNFADGHCFGLDFYRDELYADCYDKIRVCVDEWNYSWGKDSSGALLFSNALQFHFLAKGKETYHIDRAEFFMPVNEGMIFVKGNECRMESTGELFRLMAGHRGGTVIPCTAESEALDILCTDHGDTLYLSVVNRTAEPVRLSAEGFGVKQATEIQVGTYSFTDNDYTLRAAEDGVLHGHSIWCGTLEKAKA